MATFKVISFSTSVLFCLSTLCSEAQEKSRVKDFDYGGWGDSIYAVLDGYIFRSNKQDHQSDTLIPLNGAQIIAFDSTGKIFKMTTVNHNGYFSIGFPYGLYKITFVKKDFQPLLVENYKSVPDQVSVITVILEKGISTQNFRIPDWKKE